MMRGWIYWETIAGKINKVNDNLNSGCSDAVNPIMSGEENE